jgi:hypothetical protein
MNTIILKFNFEFQQKALTFETTKASEKLQYVQMAIFNNSHCEEFLPFDLQDEQFCAFHSEFVSACVVSLYLRYNQ